MRPVPAAGVPLSTPVVALSVTPLGRVPVVVKVKLLGWPVAVTVKLPAVPTVKVVSAVLVIVADSVTVSVKFWVAAVPTPLVAVKVRLYTPPVPVAGVPASTVPLKVTPLGSVPPVWVNIGAGKPLAVGVKLPADPAAKVVALALVKAAAWLTVSVKFWVAGLPAPLLALMVKA